VLLSVAVSGGKLLFCPSLGPLTATLSVATLFPSGSASDYRLLEEVRRVDDVAHRCRPVAPRPQLPPQLAGLVHEANRRRVRLLLMTPGE
jgi:hypothetical protein